MPENERFFNLKKKTPKKVRDLLVWANERGLKTETTMLQAWKSLSRIKSDKNFNALLPLIDQKSSGYFKVILRRAMNLYLILYDEKVIADMLEVFIRGIDIDKTEYFIVILMDPKWLDEMAKEHGLVEF